MAQDHRVKLSLKTVEYRAKGLKKNEALIKVQALVKKAGKRWVASNQKTFDDAWALRTKEYKDAFKKAQEKLNTTKPKDKVATKVDKNRQEKVQDETLKETVFGFKDLPSNLRSLPRDLSQMGGGQKQAFVDYLANLPLKELRRRQDLITKQQRLMYDIHVKTGERNYIAENNLQMLDILYTQAVQKQQFKDTKVKSTVKFQKLTKPQIDLASKWMTIYEGEKELTGYPPSDFPVDEEEVMDMWLDFKAHSMTALNGRGLELLSENKRLLLKGDKTITKLAIETLPWLLEITD